MPAFSVIRDLSDPAFRERLGRRLPGAVEIVLVLLLAVQAARIAWLAAVPPSPLGETALPQAPATATATTAFIDLFHRQDATGAAAGADEALGYRLYGLRTASADGAMPASAILAGNDGLQQAYRVGDAVANGIILARVGSDHVVLRGGGGEHRIDLGTAPPPASATRTATSLPVGSTTAATRTAAGMPSPAPRDGGIAPDQLLASTGLRATLDGGYTLTPRGDGALFRRAGLEAGDVLVAVNGRPLDRERLGELEDELENRSDAVLTVKRGGQTRTITLQAKQP